jgi:hypothetical protein
MSDALDTTGSIQFQLPFDSLAQTLRQLEVPQLRRVIEIATEALTRREEAPPEEGDDELDPETRAAIERSRRMMARSRDPAHQAELSRFVDELWKQWGIDDVEPVGAERLTEMMREEGIRAEDNLFSREIIAMREE